MEQQVGRANGDRSLGSQERCVTAAALCTSVMVEAALYAAALYLVELARLQAEEEAFDVHSWLAYVEDRPVVADALRPA